MSEFQGTPPPAEEKAQRALARGTEALQRGDAATAVTHLEAAVELEGLLEMRDRRRRVAALERLGAARESPLGFFFSRLLWSAWRALELRHGPRACL